MFSHKTLFYLFKWRKGWDSNPRAPIKGQLDFESSALRPSFATFPRGCISSAMCNDGQEKSSSAIFLKRFFLITI